jgi:hypothetical protein
MMRVLTILLGTFVSFVPTFIDSHCLYLSPCIVSPYSVIFKK